MRFKDYLIEKQMKFKCMECGKMKKKDDFARIFVCKDCLDIHLKKQRKARYKKMGIK